MVAHVILEQYRPNNNVLQAWYDWGTYSFGNSYVGGNYDTSVGYHQVLMYITGYTTTSVIIK